MTVVKDNFFIPLEYINEGKLCHDISVSTCSAYENKCDKCILDSNVYNKYGLSAVKLREIWIECKECENDNT